jgi:hypothetical protein
MSILSSALPGFRDLRAPLIAGYLWLLFGWLLADPDFDREHAEGLLRSLLDLADTAGDLATAAAVSVAAYLVGAVSRELSALLATTTRRLVTSLAALQVRWSRSPFPLPPRFRFGRRVYVTLNLVLGERTQAARVSADRLRDMVDQQAVLLRDAADDAVQALREGLQRELEFPATLLVGEQPATFAEADRLRAEGELRLAVVPPMVALVALLTVDSSDWWLATLPALLLLLVQGIRREDDARSVVAGAILFKKAESAALRRFDDDIAELNSRIDRLLAEHGEAEAADLAVGLWWDLHDELEAMSAQTTSALQAKQYPDDFALSTDAYRTHERVLPPALRRPLSGVYERADELNRLARQDPSTVLEEHDLPDFLEMIARGKHALEEHRG